MEWPKRFIHKRHYGKAICRSRCQVAFWEVSLPPLLPHDCDTGVTMPWQKLMLGRPEGTRPMPAAVIGLLTLRQKGRIWQFMMRKGGHRPFPLILHATMAMALWPLLA
jgi:hypothetical protein